MRLPDRRNRIIAPKRRDRQTTWHGPISCLKRLHTLLFIAVFLIIGILIVSIPAAILAWCLWRLTKRLPTWLRLQIILLLTTFLAALIFTPIGGAGQGVVLPLGLILVFHLPDLFYGASGDDLRRHILEQAVTFLCVWGVIYFISMVVLAIRSFIRKSRSNHAA